VCGPQTWSALVEAGYHLGDRHLYLRQPLLRGDDVAELQQRLGALGFDAGRTDGKLGPLTEAALRDFQRNAGLTVDGVCGPSTLAALNRLGERCRAAGPGVAEVWEVERLRSAPRTLAGRRVVVGEEGGLHALANAVAGQLKAVGALATVTLQPDGSEQAAEANAAAADAFVGLRLDPEEETSVTAYFAGHRTESPGGRRLAELLQAAIPSVLGVKDGGTRGMALPVLRETRMPAVLCELGPATTVVERTGELGRAVASALESWAASPPD
jgi:N-acetylmuramoyl-L-alanine amidase